MELIVSLEYFSGTFGTALQYFYVSESLIGAVTNFEIIRISCSITEALIFYCKIRNNVCWP